MIFLNTFLSACNGVGGSAVNSNDTAATNAVSSSTKSSSTSNSVSTSSSTNPTGVITCPTPDQIILKNSSYSSGTSFSATTADGIKWVGRENNDVKVPITSVGAPATSIEPTFWTSNNQNIYCNYPNQYFMAIAVSRDALAYEKHLVFYSVNGGTVLCTPDTPCFVSSVNTDPVIIDASAEQLNNVPVNGSSITIQFPSNVNSSTINYGSTIGIYDSTGALVPCSTTWVDSAHTRIKLTPTGSLAYNSNYTFGENGVSNTDGNTENSVTSSFHTLLIKVEALPEDMHLGSVWTDTFMNTPVGAFGLKGYFITNKGSLPLNLIDLINANVPFGTPYTDEFWIDTTRSSCYAQSPTLVDSITLNPEAQCSIVVRYQPQFYGENSTLIFTVAATDSAGSQQISEPISTPYSSREN